MSHERVTKRREIRMREEEVPPPRFGQFETPDMALSDIIKKMLSNDPQAIMVLANIEHNDITRLDLFGSIARNYKLEWLTDIFEIELSLTAAIKGLRSGQITEIAKAPQIMTPDSGMSLFGRAREKLHL